LTFQLNCMNIWEGNSHDYGEMVGFCFMTTCCVCKSVLASKNITVHAYLPLFACSCFMELLFFPKIKSMLEGTYFVLADDVKQKQRRP
jgi:hypothetical protein